MENAFLFRRWGFPLLAARIFFCLILLSAGENQVFSQTNWTASAEANNYKNPYQGNSEALAAGKSLYQQLCAVCHGDKGKGNGLAGMTLNPRPANFTNKSIQNQSDGAIFWKITEGKPPMASYKASLTEQQRWQLVNFIRELRGK